VDVIDVRVQVTLVPDQVLPVTSLPYSPFGLGYPPS
jgi:hypothetical protein